MFRHLLAIVALLLASASALAQDGQPNRYHVTINADATRARIEASVWIEGRVLGLFNVTPTAQLKNGQAEFLEKIVASDTAGKPLALTDKGEGEYELNGNRRVALSYEVRLEHGNYAWPAGAEEVSYRTDEGIMATGYALFLLPVVKMHGPTEVSFTLPPGWTAHTPWRAGSAPNSFIATSRRDLANNALFLGTARGEQMSVGGVDLTLVMGKRYWPQRAAFVELIERQLKSYQAMFGKPPLASRYLLVVNQDESGDGGAFSASFSQFLRGDGDYDTRPIWGRVLAHELLHFWNGISMAPADERQEWFKEGVTDYLTVVTMARNGLVDQAYVKQFLENLSRGQTVARMGMGLTPTVEEAAKDKHKNWLLVYGGGSVAALAMDVALRKASAGKVGLPEVMKALYAEYGVAGRQYRHEDIVRVARQLGGHDLGPLLERIVRGKGVPDQRATFRDIGLQLEQYWLLETYLLRDPKASPEARQRFRDIFGMAY